MDKEDNPRRKKMDLQQQHKSPQTRRDGGNTALASLSL